MQSITSRHNLVSTFSRLAVFCRSLFIPKKISSILSLIIGFILITSPADLAKALPGDTDIFADYLNMPWEYGEVIYRINAQSSKQLYIIGISHRDPVSGANNSTTVRTQMEIFRIGEWLKNTTRLNLLLPEGYFGGGKALPTSLPSAVPAINTPLPAPANSRLLERLGAERSFVNAEMLLMEYLDFRVSQVEDRDIYNAVRNSLGKLDGVSARQATYADKIAEIKYLQEIRTMRILQNIPAVIESEFNNGAIGERSALFTIGLNHIKDIVRYVESNSLQISSQPVTVTQAGISDSALNLLQSGYGITIILPRTLADNRKLLQMTRIDQIVLAANTYTK